MDWRFPVRRIVSELAGYVWDLGAAACRGWSRFFFRPADPTALGLIRILAGGLAFWSLLVFGLDFDDYFGPNSWADAAIIRESLRERQPWAWSFWFLVPESWLWGVWLGCLGVIGLATLGLFSRVTGILTWVIVVSTVRRLPVALFGFDQILSTLWLYLAVTMAGGQAVSLDRFWSRWRESRAAARRPRPGSPGAQRIVWPTTPGVPPASVSANLALRLIQLHLVFIYAMAGLAKVQGPSWWRGMALWGTMTAGEFVTRDFTWMVDWILLINFMTHASLAFELLYPVLVWVPLLRPIMLGGAVLLHAGIAIVAPGLTEFGLGMVAANLAFVSGVWLRSLVTGTEQPVLRIVYDGDCPRCRASMALATAADPDRVLAPIDLTVVDVQTIAEPLTAADCLRAMHVVDRSGRVTVGFDGVRTLASWIPLFWPLALLFWLPGVSWAGRRLYNRIASRRARDSFCNDDVCGIPPPLRNDPHSRSGEIVDSSLAVPASDLTHRSPS
jgi:predicted DCC family thiol-disulfide oxidoreductase YuxK